jgi:DNA-binding transcriptional LysR family regulator
MLLSQVEAFVRVAREGNLSRAAQALFVTQPALTARLQQLEAELGQPLFIRTQRGMRLTDAGRAFLPHAERSLAALETGTEVVADLAEGIVGELGIGAAPAVSTYVLPVLLNRFVQLHPTIRLLVRTGHSEEIVDMVVRGDVHVGLVRELQDTRVASRPLYEDELVLVVNPRHAFATRDEVALEALASERLIFFDRTSSYYDLTNAMFRAAGVTPRGALELDNIDAAKKMVHQGLGVALLPNTAVTDEVDRGALRRVSLTGAPRVRRRLVAVTRRDAEMTAAAVTFAALLDQIPDLVRGARRIAPEPALATQA